MLNSRSIQDLCCLTQATLFNVCLDESDLRQLGVWGTERSRRGFTPSVWSRALLHRACQSDPDIARRVTDLLDVQFFDTVVTVRCMEETELEALVDRWLDDPCGAALPGLLWALCTDERAEAIACGSRLCHESVTLACRSFVGS